MYHEFDFWWRNSIGYEIYPISYKDSNGDGLGDLKGIISKIPYLVELGVNLLYLCPIFKSPFFDSGYDVSDYYEINPELGTLEDLKELVRVVHDNGMKLVLDLPINQTSSEHPLFQKALADPNSEERSFYYFRKGKYVDGKLLPPNNWGSFFGGSCWERVEGSDEFYLHIFGKSMPDLAWNNEKVRKMVAGIINFYKGLGIDGFRLDAMSHLAKDLSFSDSDEPLNEMGVAEDFSKFSNRDGLKGYLDELRFLIKEGKHLLLIGEAGGLLQPNEALQYSNYRNGPLNLIFNFDTVYNNGSFESFEKEDRDIKTDVIKLKENFMRWYESFRGSSDIPIYWCNHDAPRVLSQYGSTSYRDESAKMLLTTMLFFYGTPFIQYGDEIGMSNLNYRKIEDFYLDKPTISEVDLWRKRGVSDEKILRYLNRTSRLSSRSVMQWSKKENAGFSSSLPFMPLNENYLGGVDVESQSHDPYSILNFYKYAMSYRRDYAVNDTIMNGEVRIIDHNHPDVFSYLHDGQKKMMVISNMRPYEVFFSFYYEIRDVPLHNYGDVILENHVFKLRPFESFLTIVR